MRSQTNTSRQRSAPKLGRSMRECRCVVAWFMAADSPRAVSKNQGRHCWVVGRPSHSINQLSVRATHSPLPVRAVSADCSSLDSDAASVSGSENRTSSMRSRATRQIGANNERAGGGFGSPSSSSSAPNSSTNGVHAWPRHRAGVCVRSRRGVALRGSAIDARRPHFRVPRTPSRSRAASGATESAADRRSC